MAQANFKMPEDFLLKLSRLGNKTDDIIEKVLESGGEVVESKVRSNLLSVIGRSTEKKNRSTGELLRSLGVSPAKQDRNGNFNIKIGFSEPRSDAGSNAKIANIWQCNNKFKGEHRCTTPHLDEETIKSRFLAAFGTLLDSKEALLENCEMVRDKYTDCSAIDAELAELFREIDVITELTRKCVDENAANAQNQDEYISSYNGYVERYNTAKTKIEALGQERMLRLARVDAFDAFIRTVRDMDAVPAEFDDRLWLKTIDTVTVKNNGTLMFRFQNGIEI